MAITGQNVDAAPGAACVGQRVLLKLNRPEPRLNQPQVLYERIAEKIFERRPHSRRLDRGTDKGARVGRSWWGLLDRG